MKMTVVAVIVLGILTSCTEKQTSEPPTEKEVKIVREVRKAKEVKPKQVSSLEVSNFVELVKRSKGDPMAVIYAGGAKLFSKGALLPSNFADLCEEYYTDSLEGIDYYTFVDVISDDGDYIAVLRCSSEKNTVVRYIAMGIPNP